MKIDELMKKNRLEELKAVCRWIMDADHKEIATVLAEIRTIHDNLYVFCPESKFYSKIKSVTLRGEDIELNIERHEEL